MSPFRFFAVLSTLIFYKPVLSQEIKLSDLMSHLGFSENFLGTQLSRLKKEPLSPLLRRSVDNNDCYDIQLLAPENFLNYRCETYFCFNNKHLLTFMEWEISTVYVKNIDTASVPLLDTLTSLLGPNVKTSIRNKDGCSVVWVQKPLSLSFYYKRGYSISIRLSSSLIKSNDVGAYSSITDFFKINKTSYRVEKQQKGLSVIGGRVLSSFSTNYTKRQMTPFRCIVSSGKLIIGKRVFQIQSTSVYAFQAIDDKGNFCQINFVRGDPRYNDLYQSQNRILIEYGSFRLEYFFATISD